MTVAELIVALEACRPSTKVEWATPIERKEIQTVIEDRTRTWSKYSERMTVRHRVTLGC